MDPGSSSLSAPSKDAVALLCAFALYGDEQAEGEEWYPDDVAELRCICPANMCACNCVSSTSGGEDGTISVCRCDGDVLDVLHRPVAGAGLMWRSLAARTGMHAASWKKYMRNVKQESCFAARIKNVVLN